MKIIFEDKIYDIFEIINNTFFIKNDNGDIMKCRDIEFFDIETVGIPMYLLCILTS